MTTTKEHWDKVFTTKAENEVSWFQNYPKTSVGLLEETNLPLDANIIDVGGGDSHLVDVLIEKGYRNICVLDISECALERTKNRLDEKADIVKWIVCNVVDFKPSIKFDLWHDRAAFHFLISDEHIEKYISIAENSVKQGGYLILGTFSENGPEKCSGLEIKQYSESSLSKYFEKQFQLIKWLTVDHETPFHTIQNFLFCIFRRI